MNTNQKLITSKELAYAIMIRSSEDADTTKRMSEEAALDISDRVFDFFGYQRRITDNMLGKEDRDAFYMLEEHGLLKTDREENFLYNGRAWRTCYWNLDDEDIRKIITGDSKKKINEESVYETLSDEVWGSRSSSLESEAVT